MDQKKSEGSEVHKEKRPINEPRTRIPAAPDLAPAPALWAVAANENITWPRLLVEKSKRRELFQNMIQSESKLIHVNLFNSPVTQTWRTARAMKNW